MRAELLELDERLLADGLLECLAKKKIEFNSEMWEKGVCDRWEKRGLECLAKKIIEFNSEMWEKGVCDVWEKRSLECLAQLRKRRRRLHRPVVDPDEGRARSVELALGFRMHHA